MTLPYYFSTICLINHDGVNSLSNNSFSAQSDAIKFLCDEFRKYNRINMEDCEKYGVKRGLRNADGTGVLAGLTLICDVQGYDMISGIRTPAEGELIYRGINIKEIIRACTEENRYGFEETSWLLLFGNLPTKEQLEAFSAILSDYRHLPYGFAEDMILKAPSPNIMNKIARSVLALYSYDDNPDDTSLENLMRQSIELIAKLPTIMVNAYQVKRWTYDHKSMYFHQSKPEHSTAQNILRTMRSDKKFTEEEARLLDLMLILHAEHGGGNNSAFACRVLASSGTDTYSAISAAVGSLKGPRHGGANLKVMEMMEYIKKGVEDWKDEDAILEFLKRLVLRQEGDKSGLIYGIGHAVYTKSDPRAVILKESASKLAQGTALEDEFELYQTVERLAPIAFAQIKGDVKALCANVDFYSGFVYKMLRIPPDLFTPLFAISRITGWCAHRIEEITTGGRIIRPAYKNVMEPSTYIPIDER